MELEDNNVDFELKYIFYVFILNSYVTSSISKKYSGKLLW